MKIVGQFLVAVAATAVAVSMAVTGCGTTNNINSGQGTSDLGQSCQRTYDCKEGLICQSNVCYAPMPVTDAGTTADGAPTTPTGPHLGLVNESCQTSNDCQSPLACVHGTCTPVAYNLTATGKSCTGECNTADDCCQVPPGQPLSFASWCSNPDSGYYYCQTPHYWGPGQGRCEDILAFIGGDANICTDVAMTSSQLGLSQGCFAYKTYCKCNPGTWTCASNQCSYAAPCTENGPQLNGCPQATRLKGGLSGACMMNGATGACASGCATANDCAGKIPSGGGSRACSAADAGATNCTCYQSSCYFMCTKDIDCAGGYTCDQGTHLCKIAPCTSNSDCVILSGNPRSTCSMGTCKTTCSSDIECGPPDSICANGTCTAAGCSTDANCTQTNHPFCVTAPATMSPYTGAITN